MSTLAARMIGSARLDAASYEEVEADHRSTIQAIGVVVASSVAAAIGTGLKDPGSIIGLTLAAMLSWLLWVLLTLFIGTRLMPTAETHSDFGEVLRTTGFSASVGLLRVFGLIPGIGPFIFYAVTIWMLFTFVIAIRQALDYTSTMRAFAVSVLGWAIHGLIFFTFVMAAM
jgi:hypothetical protein